MKMKQAKTVDAPSTEVTKKFWKALPKEQKRKRKDGSCWVLMKTKTGDVWCRVYWKS